MRRYLLTIMVLAMVPALAFGQAMTTGRISGSVMDEEGEPIAGARVTFISPSLQGERTTETDSGGEFLAALLPVGPYAVSIAYPGKQTVQVALQVTVGETAPISVTMKEGEEMTEEVTVYATATPLETTTLGENFNYDTMVEELPIQGRDIEDVASFSPNITYGPTGNNIAIAGAPSFDTVVLLDGAEVSDPYYGSSPALYLEDAVEEVQVMTSGISARYGRFQGGVVNAITKSGGNDFDGTLRAEFSQEDWNEQSPADEPQSDELDKVYNATVGGYILKDRLWFFGGYRYIPEESNAYLTRLTQDSITSPRDENRWQLKAKGAITPNHVVEVSHLEYEAEISNRSGLPSYDARAANGQREDPRDTWTVAYQGVMNSTTFLDVQYTQKNVSIASGGQPIDRDGDTLPDNHPMLHAGNQVAGWGIFNNHWWDQTDASVRDNETIGANLTKVLSAGDWGDHTIEVGGQYVKSTTGGENRQSSTGFNLLNYDIGGGDVTRDFVNCDYGSGFGPCDTSMGTPVDIAFNIESVFTGGYQIGYRWDALPLGGDQEIENTGLYVQDTWEFGKWRFDAGVRWDMYEGQGPLPTMDIDFDELAPRAGLTYNIDRNWQLQATYGRYVSRFNDNVASNVTGVSGAPRIETIYTGPAQTLLTYEEMEAVIADDANWGFVNAIYDPSQPTVLMDPDASAPYADDYNFSVKRALPRNTGSVTVTYTNRKYKQLLDDFTGPFGTVSVVDPGGSGTSFDFDLAIWDNSSIARRDYEAVTATWDYRPSAVWNFGGNWTYSQTQGNYEGESRNRPSSGSVIGDYPDSIPFEAAVPYGALDEDMPHQVRMFGNYRFNFDRKGSLSLGGLFTYQSGRNWSRVASVNVNDDPAQLNDTPGTYNHFFDGRGNNRFSGWWSLDFSARYQVQVWKDVNAWVKLNVVNLLNNDTQTSFSTAAFSSTNAAGTLVWNPSSSFGTAPTAAYYQTPREYLITIGFLF